ncbi:MAG: DUF1538 domain-containing protein [Clostridia bacterium]|nr:DUF1538 domain-containing protein [Clostridia bacterium]
MDKFNLISFIFGSILLVLGMCFYTLGVDTAMTPIGEHIGSKVTKSRKIWYILLIGFVLGVIITIAEPDLAVLESQSGVKSLTIIIAIGIGAFMLIAILRILFRIKLKYLLLVLYGALFTLIAIAIFINKGIIPLSFDSGGVTTGPITVPFIIALSSGVTGVLGGSGQEDSEFGTIGICSVGPILMVLIVGLLNGTTPTSESYAIDSFSSFGEVILRYLSLIPHELLNVLKSLAPIIIFFFCFQFLSLKLNSLTLIKIIVGLVYSVFGLAIFFAGVNAGFMPTGAYIGKVLALTNKWLIIPIGMLVGLFIVFAEPAVHVLANQVEDVTEGVISSKTMLFTLAISMAIAVGLAMLRVITKVNLLWIIIPGYTIALAMTFIVQEIFTGIAFDSGGVASGPMTATFLLPFTAGSALTISGVSGVNQTFGVVALVAMTPLLAIQIIGVIYNVKTSRQKRVASGYFADILAHEGEIIDLEILADPSKAKTLYKEGIEERIKNLQTEIDILKQELNNKRAELVRYMKRRNLLNKEE